MAQKTKKLGVGESYSSPIGSTLHFECGAFTTSANGCYCFVHECDCIQGKNGLTDLDGNPLDIDYYAVQVTDEARDKHIAKLLEYSKKKIYR